MNLEQPMSRVVFSKMRRERLVRLGSKYTNSSAKSYMTEVQGVWQEQVGVWRGFGMTCNDTCCYALPSCPSLHHAFDRGKGVHRGH